MLLKEYKGYMLRDPLPTGGKAGRGNNKTSSIQIRKNDLFVVKSIRYKVKPIGQKAKAILKAMQWIDTNLKK